MYETKVPGTRYTIALTNVKGQWYIQIKLDGIVESEIIVKELSEIGVLENIKTVVSEVNLYLNDFIIDQIAKEITSEAEILLKEVAATAATVSKHTTSSEMSAIEETLIQIVKRIETLEERIQRLESTLEHRV
ncbi:MAG: hypothetical protein KAU62_08915 [Candidatus Heimdallarchaeota archaeon]|nr:hypothetical protein [Candidatus Heimdallarchaeota archaeon]MCG3256190.1 hypothetical protein [Candidatus Heimdallarchaeota archaeon]MCK4611259.1 hypothetical protein [Candidatus Heimdallarchaeota archaeon]